MIIVSASSAQSSLPIKSIIRKVVNKVPSPCERQEMFSYWIPFYFVWVRNRFLLTWFVFRNIIPIFVVDRDLNFRETWFSGWIEVMLIVECKERWYSMVIRCLIAFPYWYLPLISITVAHAIIYCLQSLNDWAITLRSSLRALRLLVYISTTLETAIA